MSRRAPRNTYLAIIDRDRKERSNGARAAEPGRAVPPRVRRDYPRHAALRRELARHYERCKQETKGRFPRQSRRKNYCSRVAWTIVRKSGRFADYPTFQDRAGRRAKETVMRRNRKGQFVKYKARAASRKRRARAAAPRRRHHVTGYTMHRRGRTVHVKPHTSNEPRRPRRRRRRRARAAAMAPRRHMRRRSGGGRRPVIVVANSPVRRRYMRRSYRARTPPLFTLPGMVVFGVGGVFGAEVADLASRYFLGIDPSTAANALPSAANNALPSAANSTSATANQGGGITSAAQYNDLVMASPPSLKRVGIELGVSLLGWLGGGLAARAGMGLMALFGYGFGFGATFHIGTALVDGYLIQPLFADANGNPTANGQRMFQHEFNAKSAKSAAKAGGGTLGAPPVSRAGTPVFANPARPMLPAALATLAPALQPRRAAGTLGDCVPPGTESLVPRNGGTGRCMTPGCGCQSCRTMTGPAPQPPAPPPPQPPAPPTSQVFDGSTMANPAPTPTQTAALGEPPVEVLDPYDHPMRRAMIAGPRASRLGSRRAA